MKKTKKILDPITENRKSKRFIVSSMFARLAIRLSVKVREKRKEKNWGLIHLANETDLSLGLIRMIDVGEDPIHMGTLKILIDTLNFTKEDLAWIFETKT